MLLLARIVKFVTGIIVTLIVIGILLVVFDAKESNDIVGALMDAARFFVKPFGTIFDLSDAKAQVALNWGIAAVVYSIVGGLIARLLAIGSARRSTSL